MKIVCRICFKEFNTGFIFKPIICSSCFSQFEIIDASEKVLNCNVKIIYAYNDFFKSLLYRYKGNYDYLLKDVFLSRFIYELRLKYCSYIVVFPPSNLEDDNKRGYNHIEEIVSSCKFNYLKVFYKKKYFKQSELKLLQRKHIYKDIGIDSNYNLKGKKVLLIDDVITSKNTIKACILLLKKCQVKKIEVLVLSKKT
jgi:predicted amidophosphoribosyltransferase